MDRLMAGFPTIEPSHYVVLYAERATGIVLTFDGQYWIGEGEVFIVCDSFEAAQQFGMEAILANPLLECVIYSAEKTHVTTVRGPFPCALTPSKKKPWWKFWG